ncbi:hypothetical protein [Paraclostridium bifermentans]|uniref:hypothetical protein n=1 Tax=Paraclostridium bifermentans TaxID=1490 RepID=UPI00359C70D8
MLKKCLKKIHKNAAILVALSPILAFVLLIFLKFNPVWLIQHLGGAGGETFYNYIDSNKLVHTVNYTIAIVIINTCASMFAFSPDINISIRNRSMKDDVSILKNPNNPNHKASTFLIQIDADYKGLIWYKIIEVLGGIIINIKTPNWAEPTLNNTPWDNSDYTKDNFTNLIQIDITKALSRNLEDYKGEVFVGVDIITNITSFNEAPIEVTVLSRSNKKIKSIILNFIINNVISIKYKNHKIRVDY